MQNFSNFLNQIENKRLCRFQSDISNSNIEFNKCNDNNTTSVYSTVDSTTTNIDKINDNIHINDNNLNNNYPNTSNHSSNVNGLY